MICRHSMQAPCSAAGGLHPSRQLPAAVHRVLPVASARSPVLSHTSSSGPGRTTLPACHARRKDDGMTVDERLERLQRLSEVGEMGSGFSTPDVEIPPDVEEEEGGVSQWEGNPSSHNVCNADIVELPGQQPDRKLVAKRDFKEDEAIIQVPMHNCLVVYMAERVWDVEALPNEIEAAAMQLQERQLLFLEDWQAAHDQELPTELVSILADFSEEAFSSQEKVALWLLWAGILSTSAYWCSVLDELPEPSKLGNPVLATDWELEQMQWPPATELALERKAAVHALYDRIAESGLAEKLGFRMGGQTSDDESSTSGGGSGEGEQQAAPELTFELFAWAYIHAQTRGFVYGERFVFFPQIEPCLYHTNDVTDINGVVGLVKVEEEDMATELAVMAAMRDVAEGEVLRTYSPISSPGLSNASSDEFFYAFGAVPPGNEEDLLDLDPEVGTNEDFHLKTLFGQAENNSLDVVTDPRLRHLLGLVESGQMPAEDLPPLSEMLPALQVPKLWGPGLVAGLGSIQHVETTLELPPLPSEDGTGQQPGPSYENVVRQVPGDDTMWESERGRQVWRRMRAALASLPKVPAENATFKRCMDAAVAGAPLAEVFPSPRDIERERASCDALVSTFESVVASFATTWQQDEELLEAAAEGSEPLSPAMLGVVQWRRERKLIWATMLELVREYKDALAQV